MWVSLCLTRTLGVVRSKFGWYEAGLGIEGREKEHGEFFFRGNFWEVWMVIEYCTGARIKVESAALGGCEDPLRRFGKGSMVGSARRFCEMTSLMPGSGGPLLCCSYYSTSAVSTLPKLLRASPSGPERSAAFPLASSRGWQSRPAEK